MNSIKASGGLIEEITSDPRQLNPLDILIAMERNFIEDTPLRKVQHEFTYDNANTDKYLLLYAEMLLQRQFGKYIPAKSMDHVKEAFKWVDDNCIGNPIEDKMAILVPTLQRLEAIESWKRDMQKVKGAAKFPKKPKFARKKAGKWNDIEVWENPPLMKKYMQVDKHGDPALTDDGKRVYKTLSAKDVPAFLHWERQCGNRWKPMVNNSQHENAWYSLCIPDYSTDLGKDEFGHRACTRNNENTAAITMAKRLNLDVKRGGAHTVVEKIMGDGFTASWMAIYEDGTWNVKMGYQRTNEAPSSYWLVGNELTDCNPNYLGNGKYISSDSKAYIPRLTVREVEANMSLLASAKDLHIYDEEAHHVDSFNEEEEFLNVTSVNMRTDFIDTDIYAEDDIELIAINFLKSKLERSERGLTVGDIHSNQAMKLIYGEQVKETVTNKNGTRTDYRYRGGLLGTQQSIKNTKRALAFTQCPEQAAQLSKTLNMLIDLESFYNELVTSYELITHPRG